MNLTFGERIALLEEKVESCAAILEILLKAMGFLDENGEWVDPPDPG